MIIACDFDGHCIYQIQNMLTKDSYIGSAINLKKRIKEHLRQLNNGNHHSIILQRAVNKYGINNFEIIILEYVNKEKLLEKEQFYINKLNPIYNICKTAGSSLGVKRREETIEKIRKANLGIKHPFWRNEIKSKSQSGKPHKKYSEIGRLHCSEAQIKLYKNGYVSPQKGKKADDFHLKLNREKNFIKIEQYDKQKNLIKIWDSPCIVQEKLKICSSNISNCLNNKRRYAGGFIWKKVLL